MPGRPPEPPAEAFPPWIRALIECSPDFVFHFTHDGILLHTREPHASFVDTTQPDAGDRRLRDYMPADVVKLIQSAGAQARNNGRPIPITYTCPTAGRMRRYEGHVAHISDDEFLHVARDVTTTDVGRLEGPRGSYSSLMLPRFAAANGTDTQTATDRWSEEWLRCLDNAAQQAFDGIGACDMDGVVVFINPAFAQMHGYEPEELIGKHLSIFHTAEQMRTTVSALNETLANVGFVQSEVPHKHRDGHTFLTWMSCMLMRNANGVPFGILAIVRDISDRERAAAALKDSEERFRTVVDASKDAIVAIDSDGLITVFNPSAERMFDRRRDEVLGEPLDLLMPPEYRDRHRRDVASYFETGKPDAAVGRTLELPAMRRDGTVFPIELSLSVGEHEHQRFVLAVIREITERREAEDLLRLQRDLGIAQSLTTDLSEALDQVLDTCCRIEGIDCGAIYRVDRETGQMRIAKHKNVPPDFVEATRFFPNTRPFGLRIELDRPIYGRPADAAPEPRPFEQAGFKYIAIMPVEHDRSLIAAVGLASYKRDDLPPMTRNALETIAARLGSVIVRIEAREQLQRSEERFRALAETTPTGILIEQDDRVRYANPAIVQMLGWTVDELIGRDTISLIHPDMRELIAERRRARKAGEPVPRRYEVHVIHKDGSERWVDFAGRECEYDGQPALLVAALDITDRKIAEAEARRHLEHLAHLNRLNTMGEMASSLAHELNQPLSAISNYLASVTRRVDRGEPDIAELMADVQAAALQTRRAGDLVRHIKHFIRKQEPMREALDINESIRQAMALSEDIQRQYAIELRCELAADLPPACADAVQLQQVILNLVRNGVEALASNPPGRARLMTIRTALDGDERLRVVISDTGPGLLESESARIFEPFYTTKRSGLGLGLSLSRSIIEAHGGQLTAAPNQDGGLTFEFSLPISHGEPDDEH